MLEMLSSLSLHLLLSHIWNVHILSKHIKSNLKVGIHNNSWFVYEDLRNILEYGKSDMLI